jgi:molybdopterin-biosynthesis enzyme MoeA-like protein
MVTRNVSLKDFVDVEEKCLYLPHPENPEWTLLRQETNISCASMPGLKSMAEKIEQKCAEKFQQNSVRGREVVEYVCKALERAESAAAAALTTRKSELQLVVSAPSKAVAAAAIETNFQQSSSNYSHSNTNMMRRIWERAEFVGATF